MKLCLLLLLAAASSVFASPVTRIKMGRNTDQEDQGRLLPIAIFNNGVTTSSTSTTAKPASALAAAILAAATAAGGAALPPGQTAPIAAMVHSAEPAAPTAAVHSAEPAAPTAAVHSAKPATPTAVVHSAEPAAPTAVVHSAEPAAPTAAVLSTETATPTRNVLQGLQPTPVENLPSAHELAEILNQQQAGTSASPTLPSAFAGLANFFNPFRFLGQNNFANTLAQSQSAVLNQAQDEADTHKGVYLWTPSGGAVPYTAGSRKRVLDEPEQIDPNYLRLLQELYYSSRQNLQQSSYFTPQFSNPIGYPTPVGYTNPIPNDSPYSQQQFSAYQPYEAPLYYSAPPAANNPYYPMYLFSVTPNSATNGPTQNQGIGAGSETIIQHESQPGTTIDQDAKGKIKIEKHDAKPEIVVQEAAAKVDIKKKDTTKNKSVSEIEKTSGIKLEKVPIQQNVTEQGKTHSKDINQHAGGEVKDPNSTDCNSDNRGEPSNFRENSKSFVKFSRDPAPPHSPVYQEHQSRGDIPRQDGSHGQLVSSYRLQNSSAP